MEDKEFFKVTPLKDDLKGVEMLCVDVEGVERANAVLIGPGHVFVYISYSDYDPIAPEVMIKIRQKLKENIAGVIFDVMDYGEYHARMGA